MVPEKMKRQEKLLRKLINGELHGELHNEDLRTLAEIFREPHPPEQGDLGEGAEVKSTASDKADSQPKFHTWGNVSLFGWNVENPVLMGPDGGKKGLGNGSFEMSSAMDELDSPDKSRTLSPPGTGRRLLSGEDGEGGYGEDAVADKQPAAEQPQPPPPPESPQEGDQYPSTAPSTWAEAPPEEVNPTPERPIDAEDRFGRAKYTSSGGCSPFPK
jgi:hypothetical protein